MSSKKSIYTLGASDHSRKERSENGYYDTGQHAVKALLEREFFDNYIWEPCVGRHKISDVLEAESYQVRKSDIFSYGYDHEILDFLTGVEDWRGDIITNPPYSEAAEFVETALKTVDTKHKVAMFLRLAFLESSGRYERIFKENPPKTIYVFSNRQVYGKIDDFIDGSAISYAWFVWEKGYKGPPQIKWIY